MARAFILVLDSFGIGALPDADRFGDAGADTLGHIAEACANGDADVDGLRSGPLFLPHMAALGLGLAAKLATGRLPAGLEAVNIQGVYAACEEVSNGKDTPSGHWEMAGVPVRFDWGYFPPEEPSFPQELVDEFVARTGVPGILGNKHASGTDILVELGEEHVRTGKPICYTSADSVFQIAAHEEAFGLERLYEICLVARELVDKYNIGRVIARPFTGEAGAFARTHNRKDYSVLPPAPTLLDAVEANDGTVVSIGKIADIFAHQGITKALKGKSTEELFDLTLDEAETARENTLVFTNFVDYDALYGHRRNVAGYAAELEKFDALLPELLKRLRKDDLVVITADHGCDPTWKGTDHTREHVPALFFGPCVGAGSGGVRSSFADIGQTIAKWLGIELDEGTAVELD